MDHSKIHFQAVTAAANHRKTEMDLLNALEIVWRNKTYYEFGCQSLFEYSTQQLKLSDELASIFNKLAKKFIEVPELKTHIASGEISISKGNRVCSVITPENAEEWLAKAKGTKRNLEKEIAKAQPEKAIPERARYRKAGDTVRIQISYSVTEDEFKELERAKDLMSQKLGRTATTNDVCVRAVKTLLQKIDPLEKSCLVQTAGTINLTVKLKRKVHHNHNSQCTYRDESGKRCTQRRHLDIHHITPTSLGGTNDENNLTIFCSGHHRAHHRH